jgi:hypothetical protein
MLRYNVDCASQMANGHAFSSAKRTHQGQFSHYFLICNGNLEMARPSALHIAASARLSQPDSGDVDNPPLNETLRRTHPKAVCSVCCLTWGQRKFDDNTCKFTRNTTGELRWRGRWAWYSASKRKETRIHSAQQAGIPLRSERAYRSMSRSRSRALLSKRMQSLPHRRGFSFVLWRVILDVTVRVPAPGKRRSHQWAQNQGQIEPSI